MNKKAVVHCITNVITINDCANILLAIGASPTMAHALPEVEEVTSHCDALVLNLGATEWLEAMFVAGRKASALGHPIVLDPVGVAGSTWRREQCLRLLDGVDITCIRGNAAEIRALYEKQNTGVGVDDLSSGTSDNIEKVAMALAKRYNTIVIASGATDLITDGTTLLKEAGGSVMMRRITGAGCMVSSLLGAFLAEACNIDSARRAICCANRCAETAEARTQECGGGTMTFRDAFIDAVSLSEALSEGPSGALSEGLSEGRF